MIKLNHFICPNCGHDFYTDCAYTTCDSCGYFFYAAQSITRTKSPQQCVPPTTIGEAPDGPAEVPK